ncbi:MAG: AAA family ATPase [Pseudohongiellaceae bacterium]
MVHNNPFQPGYGLTPPYLAGREEQQSLFSEKVQAMAGGKSVNGVVMYGPRGVGKTTLLRWLENHCEANRVVPLTTTPAKGLKSVESLARVLLPSNWLPDEFSLSAGGRLKMEMKWLSPKTKQEGALEDHLITLCQKRPRVLLVDEAHDPVNPALYKELLQMSQAVADKAPFLLVLAGTPGLNNFLRTLGATFIERADKLGVSRLDKAAAADAIQLPLQTSNISLGDHALSNVIQDAQGYPFFLQQWGGALWRHAATKNGGIAPSQTGGLTRLWRGATKKDATELTQEDIDTVKTSVQTERVEFYESRYEELMANKELLGAANAVADAFEDRESFDGSDMLNIIKGGLQTASPDEHTHDNKAQELMAELNRIDFIWRPPGLTEMIPGIPSLMAYVRGHA